MFTCGNHSSIFESHRFSIHCRFDLLEKSTWHSGFFCTTAACHSPVLFSRGVFICLDPSEEKKVEFFGDLDETQASEIVSRLKTKEPYTLEYLREQLTEDPGIVEMVSSVELVRQSKKYRIRKFLDSLPSEVRRDTVITIFRDVLSTYKGVTGKWVQEV